MLQFEKVLNTPGRSRGDCTIVSTLNELYSGDLFLELWNPKKLFIEVKKMNDFKIGDEVVCVDSDAYLNITKGNTYPVLDVWQTNISIRNDNNSKVWYTKQLFIKVEQMNKENWKPKVGEPCDYGGLEVIPDHVGKEFVIFTIPTGFEQCDNIIKFKPIKIPAEIEQDRIIDKALELLGHSRGDFTIVSILKQLYHANLLSDKRVKPLSKSYATTELCLSIAQYAVMIDEGFIVQGGE